MAPLVFFACGVTMDVAFGFLLASMFQVIYLNGVSGREKRAWDSRTNYTLRSRSTSAARPHVETTTWYICATEYGKVKGSNIGKYVFSSEEYPIPVVVKPEDAFRVAKGK